MRSIRVIHDPPARGAWNMAVDEALLESAASSGGMAIRFYQWAEPTLSLGYFQSAADRQQHLPSRECPLVRRASGGGAILHDRELTYCVTMPQRPGDLAAARNLLDACHETLIAMLADFRIAATLVRTVQSCDSQAESPASAEPFLCFQRRSCTDIVCGEAKIVGSAQRRRRGAVLQHGSILLARSRCAPELLGIQELTGAAIDPADLACRWIRRLAARLGATPNDEELSSEEISRAQALEEGTFAATDFVERR
jgi:lipoyl(octanoyl) transferase